jgi:glucosamine-phosphate N-acetyltransferase
MIIIRHACPSDYSSHVPLYKQLTSIDPDVVTFQLYCNFLASLSSNHCVYVAVDMENQRVVGSITLLIETKLIHNLGCVGHIEDVVVDVNVRGGGIGKLLVEHATNYAREKGCYKVILDCADHNVGFYKKNGYSRKGIEMAYYF